MISQASRTSQARIFDVRLPRTNRLRVVFDLYGRAGTYHPVIRLHLTGPNSSVRGYGPKTLPRPLAGNHTLPHLRWRTAWKLRRIGGLHAYRVIARAYRKGITR